MIECTKREAREALPDLVHGRLSELDTATLRAHVESCASCTAEVALLREVRSSAPLAPPMDISRIAAAIPAAASVHVPAQARRAPSRFQFALVGLAAAAAIIAAGSLAVDRNEVTRLASTRVAVTDSPSPVAPQMSTPAEPAVVQGGEPSLALVAEVEGLTDAELETLIAEVDGMDGMPSVEPQSIPLSLDDIEGDSSSGAGE